MSCTHTEGLQHDCSYVDARNVCVELAAKYADGVADKPDPTWRRTWEFHLRIAHGMSAEQQIPGVFTPSTLEAWWNFAFHRKVGELWKNVGAKAGFEPQAQGRDTKFSNTLVGRVLKQQFYLGERFYMGAKAQA